ncbi:MAG: glycosyltransferase family 9 protein [Bdellovibrionota bacterium]
MRILIFQTAFLGDVILSTPVVENIKMLYKDAEIYTLTTPLAEVFFKYNPNVSKTLVYNKKQKGLKPFLEKLKEIKSYNFDMVFVLQKSYRTAVLLFLSRIKRRIGFKSAKFSFLHTDRVLRDTSRHDALRNLSILSKEKERLNIKDDFKLDLKLYPASDDIIGKEFIEKIKNLGGYVLLSPGSVWNTKRWDADEYKALVKKLLENNFSVVLTGSKGERELCDYIASDTKALNLAGETSLEQTMYLASNAKGIVCNDSMMLHLASAFKVPNVVVFCATVPEFGFGPWQNDRAVVVEDKSLKCRPCGRHGTKVCKTGTNACQKISHIKVYESLMEMMNK